MTTIPGLTDYPATPMTGAEKVPVDTGAATFDATSAQFANLGALYASAQLGAAPERLDAAGTHFTTQGAGDPLTVWFPPASIVAVAGFGYAAAFTGLGEVFQRRIIGAAPTRIWEVEAEVEQVSVGGGESPVARVGLRSLKSDLTDTDGTPTAYAPASAVLTAGQIITLTYRFGFAAPTGGMAWADPSTAALFRPVVQVNQKSDLSGSAAASVARIRRLTVRDVTAVVAIERSVAVRTREKFVTLAIASGVLALDLSLGNLFIVPWTSNISSVVVSGYPPTGEAQGISVVFVGDGTVRTIAWPGAVKWSGGTAPTFVNTVNYENWVTFVARDAVSRLAGFNNGNVAP